MKTCMKKWDLKNANAKYLEETAAVTGVKPGPRYSRAWLRAMEKIKKDPVRFYLDRIWYHNRRIRDLHDEIVVHQRKIHTLMIMVKRIERKRNRS